MQWMADRYDDLLLNFQIHARLVWSTDIWVSTKQYFDLFGKLVSQGFNVAMIKSIPALTTYVVKHELKPYL